MPIYPSRSFAPLLRPFILREACGQRSRDNATVTLSGDPLESGQLLVAAGTKYAPYTGSGAAVAINVNRVPAANGDVSAVVITRDCEVNRFELVGLTAAAEIELAQVGIKVRSKDVPTLPQH
jgi:hypothetical protein